MSPFGPDDLDAAEGRKNGKPGFPGDNANDPQRRQWLEWAFSVSAGSHVGEITRYGADDVTPMTVEIIPPGNGKPQLVRFEEEHQAQKPASLRSALTRDAGLRAEHITSAKIAGDVYYVLCRLARVLGGGDPRDEVREWIDGYRDAATRISGSLAKVELYMTLDMLRHFPYSKRHINLWLRAMERLRADERPPEQPRPPLLVDEDGGEWTSISHLATFIRWDRDQGGTMNSRRLAGFVAELGGKRWKADAWDDTSRGRRRRIVAVMVRLPAVEDVSGDVDSDV